MDKNNGIMIFKDIFEYYKDGDLDNEGFCELMMLIYETKWGTEPDINNIQNKMCKTIWKGLRYSIKKSVRNARYQNNKTLQEVTTTEFDIPKNVENPNKADLSPSNNKEIEQPQPIRDNTTEGLEIAKNKDIPNNTENFENFLKIERNRIDNIIDDFKAGGIRAKIQAPNRLKELTNTIHGKIYEEELKTYIQEQVYAMAV